MSNLNDLDDQDASKLVDKLKQILAISTDAAEKGSGSHHMIYRLARDCLDMLVFDQVSREMVRKMTHGSADPVVMGYIIPQDVQDLIRSGHLINAIKDMRTLYGLGLKEAKDICERARSELNLYPF